MRCYNIVYSFSTKTGRIKSGLSLVDCKVLSTFQSYQLALRFVNLLLEQTPKYKDKFLDKWSHDVPNYRETIEIVPVELHSRIDQAVLHKALEKIR